MRPHCASSLSISSKSKGDAEEGGASDLTPLPFFAVLCHLRASVWGACSETREQEVMGMNNSGRKACLGNQEYFDVDQSKGLLCCAPIRFLPLGTMPRYPLLWRGCLLSTQSEIGVKKIVSLPVGSIWAAQWHPHVPVWPSSLKNHLGLRESPTRSQLVSCAIYRTPCVPRLICPFSGQECKDVQPIWLPDVSIFSSLEKGEPQAAWFRSMFQSLPIT